MDAYGTPEALDAKTRQWLDRIAPYNRHALTLNRESAALLVVDMQRFFIEPSSPTFACGGPAILPNVRRLVAAFRGAGRPVIFTRHVHHPADLDLGILGWWWEGKCVEGTPESELHPDLAPLPTEKVVLKHRYSAFYDTDLGTVLRCLKIEDVVIVGLMTNVCCESTARDAYYRDYRVFFLADATGTMNEELHIASLMNLSLAFACVTTTREIEEQLTQR